MTAQEIFNHLLNESNEKYENGTDGLLLGDANKEVHKLATCFKLTASLIPLAQEQNVDMIITHEGLFSTWNFCGEKNNRIDKLKQKVLEESEISVYRFHDHAHREPDYIHTGFFLLLI
jgi:putative NIF3 family GTP cyclohydrolase 1 type 2